MASDISPTECITAVYKDNRIVCTQVRVCPRVCVFACLCVCVRVYASHRLPHAYGSATLAPQRALKLSRNVRASRVLSPSSLFASGGGGHGAPFCAPHRRRARAALPALPRDDHTALGPTSTRGRELVPPRERVSRERDSVTRARECHESERERERERESHALRIVDASFDFARLLFGAGPPMPRLGLAVLDGEGGGAAAVQWRRGLGEARAARRRQRPRRPPTYAPRAPRSLELTTRYLPCASHHSALTNPAFAPLSMCVFYVCGQAASWHTTCLLYTSPSPRDS